MSSQKDYSSAFAELQSTYGFGGHVPSPIPKKSKTSETSKPFLPSFLRSRTQSPSPSSTSTKASFGALPSKLGASPVSPERDETKTALNKEAQAYAYLAGKGVQGEKLLHDEKSKFFLNDLLSLESRCTDSLIDGENKLDAAAYWG
ncbi:uncharacterized protein EV420DRAFT_1480932 [Desarmillaria tabescens]|uniref:Uncharacterized protein n=1 Tax=Armillaria tabescens TaxID=1929756 RepID=A0AA39K9I0_ARMTA|nr:uncharacterized protein EV420DRAFT_1480932 [Desarmillaria tabescens]KAK0457057.1 hypothetical protein EV420DRAFT_1480932 [Desarmillaria tabescens]